MKRPPRRRKSAFGPPASSAPAAIAARPPRRVLLFCPATEWSRLEKAAALGADGVIIDLEDGVAQSRKAEARRLAARALAEIDFGRTERLIRVNPAGSGLEEDVRAAATGPRPPDAWVLPKVESAADVKRLARLVGAARRRRNAPSPLRILALIETARGIVNLATIASSDLHLEALLFGAEDLCGDMGATRTRAGREIAVPRSAVAIHAAACRLQAIDTPFVDLVDAEGLLAETRDALALGYSGKMAIHPKQVRPILDVFTPNPEEIADARRVIAEHERRQGEGTGVFALEGRMIDMPMVRAARAVLARARAAGIAED